VQQKIRQDLDRDVALEVGIGGAPRDGCLRGGF
jgi:hypothetical protein